MAELKTKVNDASVAKFLNDIPEASKREDTLVLFDLMQKAMKAEPKMWGDSIVGFGTYQYKGKSGRGGEWFIAGLSPRKQSLTLYALGGWEKYGELLSKLGKYSHGKGCLYIKRLADVDMAVLRKLIAAAVKDGKATAKAGVVTPG